MRGLRREGGIVVDFERGEGRREGGRGGGSSSSFSSSFVGVCFFLYIGRRCNFLCFPSLLLPFFSRRVAPCLSLLPSLCTVIILRSTRPEKKKNKNKIRDNTHTKIKKREDEKETDEN
jgi:hypothetical protein